MRLIIKMREKKLYAIFSLLMVLVSLLSLSYGLSMNYSITIQSNGTISPYVIAKSGSAIDIQAAVNTVSSAGGGTVVIPAGTWYWNDQTVTIPGGVNVIGTGLAGCSGHPNFTSYTASTILHNNASQSTTAPNVMFYVNGIDGKQTTISGIRFEATPPTTSDDSNGGNAITIFRGLNCRVCYCTFINFAGQSVLFTDTDTGYCYGVIDHCVINNPYKAVTGGSWAYGFYIQGYNYYWNTTTAPITNYLGQYPVADESGYNMKCVMYVEDCHMSYCRHAVDAIQGAWLVARFNLIDQPYPVNYGQLGDHGAEGNSTGKTVSDLAGDSWPSARGFEFYNNTVICLGPGSGGGCAVWLRGGAGVVYDNTFINTTWGIDLVVECCAHQNTEMLNDSGQVFIWGNTLSGSLSSGVLLDNSYNMVLGSQYFLAPPNLTANGFTYTPYRYPIFSGTS
jgi:hypothetical protein